MESGTLAVLIVLGLIATLAWPRAVRSARLAVEPDVAAAAGWGLLALVAVPVVALLFAVTLIGLPIAVLILALYAVAILAAAVATACVLGDFLLSAVWSEGRPGPVWRTGAVLIGCIVLWLVTSVRVVGPVLWVVAVAWGLGIFGSLLLRGVTAPEDDIIDLTADRVG